MADTVTFTQLKIGTWNIHELRRPTDSATDETLAKEVLDLTESLDIVALQEVPFSSAGSSSLVRAVQARGRLLYTAERVLSPSMFDEQKRSGVAILSRWPLLSERLHRFPNPRLNAVRAGKPISSFDKGMLSATIDSEQFSMSIASLHMPAFRHFDRRGTEVEFADVWDATAAAIDRLEHPAIAICGDYNVRDRSILLERTVKVATSAFAGMSTKGDCSIDDILLSNCIRIIGHRQTIATFSDHRLCVVHVEVRS